MDNIGELPPHIKMLILGHLDETSKQSALELQPDDNVSPITFLDKKCENLDVNQLSVLPEELEALEKIGFIVKNQFLNSPTLLSLIIGEINQLREMGLLKSAGLNSSDITGETWSNMNVRGDIHMWLNENTIPIPTPGIRSLLDAFDKLMIELNTNYQFECSTYETQVAVYPGGGSGYLRHLDSTPNGPQRRLTCIYYLNVDWKTSDGGCLRIFDKNNSCMFYTVYDLKKEI